MLTMWAKYALYDPIDNIAGICCMFHIDYMALLTLRGVWGMLDYIDMFN
jgi:hypothetical protein